MARLIKAKGGLPEPLLSERSSKLPKPNSTWFRHLSSPNPKARHIQLHFSDTRETKKEKLYFTETDDIQRILETWLTAYKQWGPKEKDVEFFVQISFAVSGPFKGHRCWCGKSCVAVMTVVVSAFQAILACV